MAPVAPSQYQIKLEKWDYFYLKCERTGSPQKVPGGQESRLYFSGIPKPSKCFIYFQVKSQERQLSHRSSKAQRSSKSPVSCPCHSLLALWVEPTEPREAEYAQECPAMPAAHRAYPQPFALPGHVGTCRPSPAGCCPGHAS